MLFRQNDGDKSPMYDYLTLLYCIKILPINYSPYLSLSLSISDCFIIRVTI